MKNKKIWEKDSTLLLKMSKGLTSTLLLEDLWRHSDMVTILMSTLLLLISSILKKRIELY